MKVLQAEDDAGSVENCARFTENIRVNVHHQVTSRCILHDKTNVLLVEMIRKSVKFLLSLFASYFCLETREQIDQERMTHRVGDFENSLLAQQRFDFITCNYVAFFERFDSKIFAGVSVLRQNNFSEVSATENA